MHRKYFNMIEIMLAMTVISIGFIGVISLLPLGITTNRNAIENTYVTMASENMLNYIRSESKQFDFCFFRAEATSSPKGDLLFHDPMSRFALDSGFYLESQGTLPVVVGKDEGGFTKRVIPSGGDRFPKYFTMKKGNNPKMFLLTWQTEINGVPATDFECIVTAGLRPVARRDQMATGAWNPYGRVASINVVSPTALVVRVEWPAEAKVEDRSYKFFYYNVF